jgi:mannose-6-phosphate isomerase-like protein (cupin superfamily)
MHEEEHRPWGSFHVLEDGPHHKVKRIVVSRGHRLSLQKHGHRKEHWFMLDGEGIVTRDHEEIHLTPGEAIDIPEGAWHRIKNSGTHPLVFIEVQTGDYFGEDDIARAEDDYGRV